MRSFYRLQDLRAHFAALLNFYQPRLPPATLPSQQPSPCPTHPATNFRANSSLSLSKAIKIRPTWLLLVLESIGSSIYSYRYARSSMQLPIHSQLVQTSRTTKCLPVPGERERGKGGRETSSDCVCAVWRNQKNWAYLWSGVFVGSKNGTRSGRFRNIKYKLRKLWNVRL